MQSHLASFFAISLFAFLPACGSAPSSDAGDPAVMASEAAFAQEPGTVSRIFRIKLKPGTDAQWREAAAEHVAWHGEQGDTFTWIAFYVETGEHTGQYGYISSNHQWSDFDEYDAALGEADGEHAMATMGPFEESVVSSFTQMLPQFSNPAPAGATSPLYEIAHYTVDFTRNAEFLDTLARGHAALQEADPDSHYEWSVLVNGGEGMVYTLARPLSSWSDMAPERTIDQIFTEALGEEDARALMETFAQSIVSVKGWIGRVLPELSHIPEER